MGKLGEGLLREITAVKITVNVNMQDDWQQQVHQRWVAKDYSGAEQCYRHAIELEPAIHTHYWYLGLALLLQGEEAEAQAVWMAALMNCDTEDGYSGLSELVQILDTEAKHQESYNNHSVAWAIRQYIYELNPENIYNRFKIVILESRLRTLTTERLVDLSLVDAFGSITTPDESKSEVLSETLQAVLEWDPTNPMILECLRLASTYLEPSSQRDRILIKALKQAAYTWKSWDTALQIAEICLQLNPTNLIVLEELAAFYQNIHHYKQGIQVAHRCFTLVQSSVDQIYAKYLILRGIAASGGRRNDFLPDWTDYVNLLSNLSLDDEPDVSDRDIRKLFSSVFLLPYMKDDIEENRAITNRTTQICQTIMRVEQDAGVDLSGKYELTEHQLNQQKIQASSRPLRIGYLSRCLRTHSVGWLARWLIQHHRRDRVRVYTYHIQYAVEMPDPLEDWYMRQADQAYQIEAKSEAIADQIHKDQIDILVDLDSITAPITCQVLALKAAPIQVTWLGWDASGLPAVDYFMADPYVLPPDAQKYYKETIWRLPQTYIAVDGFEVGIPNLRRDALDIPSDAIVYLSNQSGYKRHPDTVRLQMQVLRNVPNSYFLIKGKADQEAVRHLFSQIAEEEGVSFDRLRFLPMVSSEADHRANLGIADVVLDTYPYNGATTTLETLWMGIPLVTRVGTQFAARNSYTMMVNGGVVEGIAWTDEEYVDWGIRLGTDHSLRSQVTWKLIQSRKTAPLWNGRQFTQDMEDAYQRMWALYLESRR
ncbi:MAG: O-linked N-acetylglucosamine transferase, SPINDLY family protein [Synechococcales bacterium]|nr:O-linked N-acetylglucosamine transferase, SPINDLY family protein [Synechococcales bacterium]